MAYVGVGRRGVFVTVHYNWVGVRWFDFYMYLFYAVLWGRKRRREEGRRGLEGRGGEGKRDMTG